MAVSNPILQKYLLRVDRLALILYKKDIIAKPHRSLVFEEIMGLSAEVYKNWYGTGISRRNQITLDLAEYKYLDNPVVRYDTEELYENDIT